MTKPLAIVFYESLLPGRQVANKLADLGYRVQAVHAANALLETVRRERPIVLLADLSLRQGDLCEVIAALKRDPQTEHIPVLAFTNPKAQQLVNAAVAAGAKLVAGDTGILEQLPQLLDHVLAVE